MPQPISDAQLQPSVAQAAKISSPTDHIRFSEHLRVPKDEQDLPSGPTSDLSSPNVEEGSTDDEWSPRLLPHETGFDTADEDDIPKLRRSSSAPSLLVFEWKPSSAFDNEGEELVQWDLEMDSHAKEDAKLPPQFAAELDESHFTDEVDPFSPDAPKKERKEPEHVELGITWSSLRKINNKLVQWSFSDPEPPSEVPRNDEDMRSEFAVTDTPPRLQASSAATSRLEQTRFVSYQEQPQRPPTSRNRSAMKVAQQASAAGSRPMHTGAEEADHLTVPCFRGLRDSIAIARSRSHPRDPRQGGDKVNQALLDGTQEKLRSSPLAEVSEQDKRSVVTPTLHGACCLTMTPLEEKVLIEPRQDSVANPTLRDSPSPKVAKKQS